MWDKKQNGTITNNVSRIYIGNNYCRINRDEVVVIVWEVIMVIKLVQVRI